MLISLCGDKLRSKSERASLIQVCVYICLYECMCALLQVYVCMMCLFMFHVNDFARLLARLDFF